MIETTIECIKPRFEDDGSVLNVTVKFRLTDDGRRFSVVTAEVYVDKATATLEEISDQAKRNALSLLKTITAGL